MTINHHRMDMKNENECTTVQYYIVYTSCTTEGRKEKRKKLRQMSLVRGQVRGGKQKTKKKEEEEDYKEKEEKGI